MPEYGQPIDNNLHWKSTLDFFKEEGSKDAFSEFLDDEYKKLGDKNKEARDETVDAFKRGEPTQAVDPKGPYTQSQAGGSKFAAPGDSEESPSQMGPEYYMTPRTQRDDDLEAPFNNSVEKNNEGEGAFDESVPMPKPRFTSADHPEGAGVPLKNGFTEKELRQLKRDDRRINTPAYPQDSDANPEYPMEPVVRKRPSRAKKPFDPSLLRSLELMKEDDEWEVPKAAPPAPHYKMGYKEGKDAYADWIEHAAKTTGVYPGGGDRPMSQSDREWFAGGHHRGNYSDTPMTGEHRKRFQDYHNTHLKSVERAGGKAMPAHWISLYNDGLRLAHDKMPFPEEERAYIDEPLRDIHGRWPDTEERDKIFKRISGIDNVVDLDTFVEQHLPAHINPMTPPGGHETIQDYTHGLRQQVNVQQGLQPPAQKPEGDPDWEIPKSIQNVLLKLMKAEGDPTPYSKRPQGEENGHKPVKGREEDLFNMKPFPIKVSHYNRNGGLPNIDSSIEEKNMSVEKTLLKLMKEDKPRFRATPRPAGQMGSSEEPIIYRPMPDAHGNLPLTPEERARDAGSSPTAGERAETTLGRRPTAMPSEMVDAARKVSARQLAYEASPEGLREDPRMRSRPPGVEPHPEEVGMYDKRKIARAAQERAAKEANPSLYNKESSVEKSLLKLMKDGSIDKDDDDMGAKKPGIKNIPTSPKNRPYGNPSPPPVQPKTEEKKSVDVEKLDVPGAIKGGIRGLRGQRHPLTGTRHERDLRRGDYGDEMRGEDVGRGIRNLPPHIAERAGSEFNPELLEDAGRAAGRAVGRAGRGGLEVARRVGEAEREALEGAKGGFGLRGDPREDINPPLGRHPAQSRAENIGERVGYGVGRAPYAVGEATRDFFQPESAYETPDRPGLMDAHARQSWRGQQASQDIAARNPSRQARGVGPLEASLLKLMKDGDQRLNAMAEDKIKEPDCCEDEDILVADGDSKRPKSEVGTNDKMFKKEHELTPEEAKDIHIQRQINRRNAPDEHPSQSKDDAAQQRAWGDKIPMEEAIENSLLKLMKEGEISPAKVGMPRRNAMKPIENAFPAQAPKTPRGVGASTQSAPPPTAHEMEARKPDTDQAGQTANWSAQMFAGDLAGKINRRFGTGKQDYLADRKQRDEWGADYEQQNPQFSQSGQTPQARDTTSQGFGQSGQESQQQFQQQTGIKSNMGKPIYSSTKK